MALNHLFDQSDCQAAATHCIISHVLLHPASSLTRTLHFSPLDIGTAKKRGWRTLSVISYRPLFSSPFFLPSCEARWKLVKWVMTEEHGCCANAAQIIGAPAADTNRSAMTSQAMQRTNIIYLGFYEASHQTEGSRCQSNSHAPVHRRTFMGTSGKAGSESIF